MRSLIRALVIELLSKFKRISPGVHIVNLHFVTPDCFDYDKDLDLFTRFISYLNSFSKLISLDEAVRRIENNDMEHNVTYISLTFDDGFEENYLVIAKVLESFNTTGSFFINANYVESDLEYQKEFHERLNVYTKKPLSWAQLQELISAGHTIGSHTLDHYNLGEISTEKIERQIVENKRLIMQKLNINCEHFAWPYGLQRDFPKKALDICLRHHKYIYSGTDYKFYKSRNGRVINRRHLEPFWKRSHINYFLSHKKEI